MKVLVVGGGGREHALAWKIKQSSAVTRLFAAPGNAGIASIAECVEIAAEDIMMLTRFIKREKIDLTVVGPEGPLVAGLVDHLQKEGKRAFGPAARAAELEGSKVFAKRIMKMHGIPNAEFRTFDSFEAALGEVESREGRVVIKADGLAAGKGVYVCKSLPEARQALSETMLEKRYGEAGAHVVVEEILEGEEASILAFTDGKNIYPLETCQDHKAIFDGDKGPNTGGMGAYCPAPVVTSKIYDTIERKILIPIVHAMNVEDRPYQGVIYAGLMINGPDVFVLEFNCRFGDPETQPLMVRLKSDLVEVIEAVIDRKLDKVELVWDPRPAICVVMASSGYPGSYPKGLPIAGIDAAAADPDVKVFHAGTTLKDGKFVTAGGRVLGVTALGGNLAAAKKKAYEAVSKIHFEGAHYRKDIADKALGR